jgi:RND family efflux transporter MFP subunit
MIESPQPKLPESAIESPPLVKNRRWSFAIAGVVIVVLLLFLVVRFARPSLASRPTASAPVVVGAAKILREPVALEKVYDSELRPYQEVELHAKVAGYVQSINVDIGDQVKEGDLIATLELPEVQDDLDRALAMKRRSEEEIKRDEAAYVEAKTNFNRLMMVDKAKPNLIAQAELDTASAREKTALATLAAAREQVKVAEAEVKKLQTMLDYARITAPFDGVITERYADKGALIQAGTSSSTQAMPLVRLSENKRLRLVFPVTVSFVASIHKGKPVKVEIPGLHKVIEAKITRTSQKVTTATRTMDAEVDIANDDLSLIPGMYAAVRLEVDERPDALAIPLIALSRAKIPTVYVIGPDGMVEERKVKLGIESPEKVEALDGVKEGELVMIGSRSQVKPGQKVTPKMIEIKTASVSE